MQNLEKHYTSSPNGQKQAWTIPQQEQHSVKQQVKNQMKYNLAAMSKFICQRDGDVQKHIGTKDEPRRVDAPTTQHHICACMTLHEEQSFPMNHDKCTRIIGVITFTGKEIRKGRCYWMQMNSYRVRSRHRRTITITRDEANVHVHGVADSICFSSRLSTPTFIKHLYP